METTDCIIQPTVNMAKPMAVAEVDFLMKTDMRYAKLVIDIEKRKKKTKRSPKLLRRNRLN